MPFLIFLFEAVLISLSGVMAPGPVTAVTIGKGNESPNAGALIAVGHGIVEFPLMIALFYGFGALLNLPYVKGIIAFAGGIVLLIMGIGMLRDVKKTEIHSVKNPHTPLVAGILLSAGNPYFLIWWATVGVALILRSVGFGLLGFVIFAFVHWLCDFVWLYFLSAASFKGGQFFGKSFQRVVFGICGVLLLFFSGKFVIDAVRIFVTI